LFLGGIHLARGLHSLSPVVAQCRGQNRVVYENRIVDRRHCAQFALVVFIVVVILYYYLGQLRPAARSLSTDAAKTLVQAFISCRLDYCNSLMS